MKLFKSKIFKFIILPLLGIGLFCLWFFVFRVPNFELETLSLNISSADFEKLSELRDVALENDFLERSEDDFVPASIVYRSQEKSGKVRLKGDWTDHLGHKKWSFRIKLKDEMDDGLKVFSIQNPKSRGHVSGYVFHKLLKQEGILTNEMRFIHLKVNGNSWGVYCLEEHLSNRMIANQGKPAGMILKFSDAGFFQIDNSGESTDGLIKQAEINTYGGNDDNDLNSKAKSIISNYQVQKEGSYTDFDQLAMAKYYALCDLTTAYHAMGWINIRFYFNYETQKMEAVGYDPYPVLEWGKPYLGNNVESTKNDPFETTMIVYSGLKDSAINTAYYSELERITHPNYIQKFMDENRTQLKFLESEIQKEYGSYKYDYNELTQRAKDIRETLKSKK
jgi:CotH kinase protein